MCWMEILGSLKKYSSCCFFIVVHVAAKTNLYMTDWFEHIEAWTKWPLFCRHCQMLFCFKRKVLHFVYNFTIVQQRHYLMQFWPRLMMPYGVTRFTLYIVFAFYVNPWCDAGCWKFTLEERSSLTMSQSSSQYHIFNTLRPRQNGRHFADDIFKCIFLNENVWIPTKISMKFVPKGPINNIPALVQIMAWRHPGDKPLSEPMMVSSTTHICVTRPQWVKSPEPVLSAILTSQSLEFCDIP